MKNSEQIKLLQKMILVREFEEMVIAKKEGNLIFGPVHTTIGQEAVDVGVCSALSPNDYIIGTHRSHGYMIAKGSDINLMMAEIYGKSTGTNGGRGGSMHVSDKSVGSLGASAIVGSGLPIACGAAFASLHKRDAKITCVFFGDGAANEGTFHESLNLAAIWKLPVLFLLKNNSLAITMSIEKASSQIQLHKRAQAYGITGYQVNGQDVEKVFELISHASKDIRSGKGPVLIEANTIRFREHQEGLGYKKIAESNYRDPLQIEKNKINDDPILIYKGKLIQKGVLTEERFKEMVLIEKNRVIGAVNFAETSPTPALKSVYVNIYSED